MSDLNRQVEIHNEILTVQKKLEKLLPNTVWDYGFVFDTELKSKIEINNINNETKDLVILFINLVNELLIVSNLNTLKAKSLSENFDLSLHAYYVIRYFEAKRLFSDYELIRIYTDAESKLLKIHGSELSLDEISYSVHIPNSIIKYPSGEVDLQLTKDNEDKTNSIKSYISTIPSIKFILPELIDGFEQYTTLGFFYLGYKKKLTEIFTKVLEKLLSNISSSLYLYLNKGYSYNQAKNNSYTYYKSLFESQDYRLFPTLENLEKDILNNIESELVKIDILKKESIEILKWEIINFVIEQFCLYPYIFPTNLYELEFRNSQETSPNERGYEYICDVYLLSNNGRYPEFAIESYGIDLTPDSKVEIFGYITNGIENPKYKLEEIINYI